MLACLIFKDFYVEVAALSSPSLALSLPSLVVLDDAVTPHVLGGGSEARAAGVSPDITELEARALYSDGVFCTLPQSVIDDAQTNILECLDRFSPSIEVLGPSCYLVDLGISSDTKTHSLAKKLISAFAPQHHISVGLSAVRFVAKVAATKSARSTYTFLAIGEERAFLSRQRITCLPVDAETLRRLDLLGIETLGDLTLLLPERLVDLFGASGNLMASLARGEDSSLMVAEAIEAPLEVSGNFDFPEEDGSVLLNEFTVAVESLCQQLTAQHRLATRMTLELHLHAHPTTKAHISFASPMNQPKRMLTLLQERLPQIELSAPVTGYRIALEGFVEAFARQMGFESLLSPTGEKWRGIQRIVDRLCARCETTSLMQVVWDEPTCRVPERRGHLQDLGSENGRRGLYLPHPAQVAPDASGFPRLVRTRSGWQPVDMVMEAWDIEEDWWTPRPISRHYYRVVLRNGAVMRLFRDPRRGQWYHQNR